MAQKIPLIGGAVNAHHTFSVQLGDRLIGFRLNYLQTGQWVVDLSENNVVIAAGLNLESECDIIEGYNLALGQLVFIGDDTTLNNLGINNGLFWVAPT